jgi:hypothetical protein
MTHRELAYKRLLDGWETLAMAHPEINFGLPETFDTQEAENRVAVAVREYEQGAPLSVIRDAFALWKQAWIANSKPQNLFT